MQTSVQRIAEAYFHLLKIVGVLCLLGMVVLVFGNVVLRYGFNSGITVSEEVSRLLFVTLTFLGAIVAMREHLHLGIDSLVCRLPPAARKACHVASHLLMLLAVGTFLVGSWQQAEINLAVKTPVTGISVAFFYGVGVVFCVSAGMILLAGLHRAAGGRLGDEPAGLQAQPAPEAKRPTGVLRVPAPENKAAAL